MKHIKKAIAVFMAFALLFVPTVAVAASSHPASDNYPYSLEDMSIVYDDKDENGNYYPLIVVPGISHSITYVVDKNYDQSAEADQSRPPIKRDAFGNDLSGSTVIVDIPSTILAAVKYFLVPLIFSIIFQRDVGIVNGIGKVADKAFAPQQTLPDGTFANNDIGLLEFKGSFADFATKDPDNQSYMENECAYLYKILPLKAVSEVIGEENLFFFAFSLFGDAMESARYLDQYIDFVLEKTGAKKVNLLPISLGGTIFTAFCQQFSDTNKVNTIANIVPVLNGTQVVTDMFNRNWDLRPEFWYGELFPMAIGEFTEYGNLIGRVVNFLIRALPASVNASMVTRLYEVLLDHLLVNTPQIWAMVQSEAYPALADKYLGDDAHKAVRAKTDAFYEAQLNLKDNIKKMVDNGVKIDIIAGYSLYAGDARYNFFHIMGNSDKVNSDGVINIESTTLGATAVLPDEKLPDSYKQAIEGDYSYISPDREVDASTGVLPDNTWYFYNMHHEDAANNAPVINLAIALLYSTEVENVHSNPEKFPQFNGNSDNWFIRRWRYDNIKELYAAYEAGELDWDEATVKEAEDIIYDCERVMKATIADDAFVSETTQRVNAFLSEYGGFNPEKVDLLYQKQLPELATWAKILDKAVTVSDKLVFAFFSDKAYSEFYKVIL
ncbi:MAG: hypothetical protein MJ147_04475 [Clostridia bacterium]|nr:hypothetical protein [Clostridia bacterium]